MLQSIEIENFRCFHRSRLENFGQVNLIGGMNNAGKTALLEALLLVNEPTWNTISFMQLMRRENGWNYSHYPELAWGNLFFQQKKLQSKIRLTAFYQANLSTIIEISCTEQPKSMTNRPSLSNGNLIKAPESATMSEIGESKLLLKSIVTGKWMEITYQWQSEQPGIQYGPSVVSEGKLEMPNTNMIIAHLKMSSEPDTLLMSSSFKGDSESLARDFDKAKLRGEVIPILEAFRMVDPSIEQVDTANLGEHRIYITRKGERPQMLNFFGDALNHLAGYILTIVNNPNCILLIDEIENGIHHTNQQEFWRMLIKLAVQKNVQIFATSHSAEMIGAFQAAAVENEQEDKVRYITLYRSARTGEIIGAQRDMETLGYNLRTDNPYRGE